MGKCNGFGQAIPNCFEDVIAFILDPFIVAPVALGILGGALIGSRLLPRTRNPTVRKIFALVLAATAIEMIAGVVGL